MSAANRKVGAKIMPQKKPTDEKSPIMSPNDIQIWNEKMSKMSFRELVQVECRISVGNKAWKKMFVVRTEIGKEVVKCVPCNIPAITKMPSIKQHILGKKHHGNLEAGVIEIRNRSNNPKTDTTSQLSQPNAAKAVSKIVLNPLSLQKKQQSEAQKKQQPEEPQKKQLEEKKKQQPEKQSEENTNTTEDLKKFRDNMGKLDTCDLLLIEYKFVNTDWQKLFKREDGKNKSSFTCSMCKNATFSLAAIKSHMSNRQHQRNIELVKELYHPILRPVKEIGTKDKQAAPTKQSEDKNANHTVEVPDDSGNEANQPSVKKSNSNTAVLKKVTPVTASKTISTNNDKNKSQNEDKNQESNVVINPAHIQKQTIEATTTGKNLKELMKSLEVIDLLKIEYRYNGITSEWKKMFVQYPDTTFKCFLCGTFLIKNLRDLRQHIESARHQTSINATQKLFHPTLAPTKPAPEKEELPKETYNQKIQQKDDGKMDDTKFREHLTKLPVEDIRKVEYLQNGKWTPLINMHGMIIMCNVCDITGIIGYKTFMSHLTGKKHSELMNDVEKLFHPVYTFAKDHVDKSSQNVRKTVEKSSDSQIICTITLEDSPEREIPNTNAKKTSEKVVNPASVIAKTNEQIQNRAQGINNQSNFQGNRFPNQNSNMNNPNQFFGQQNRNFQQQQQQPFRGGNQGDNSQRNNNFGPNINPGDRIITPRVRPQDSSNTQPSFSSKDLTSTKVEDVEGLVGVEYVVKILRNVNDTMPRFECCLCEIEVDGVGMQFHLKGLLHRKKYLERHFPTSMRQFSKYKDDPKFSYVISQICEKLAVAVERYHGRDLPFECLQEEFRSNRDGIMSKVFSFRHASELSGPSFTNSVDKNLVDQFISNRESYKAPQPDPTVKPTFDVNRNVQKKNVMIPPARNAPPTVGARNAPTLGVEEHRVLVEKFLQNTSLNAGQRPPAPRRNRSRSRSPRRRSPRSRDRYGRERSPRNSQPAKPPARSQWELYSHSLKSPVRTIGGDIWDSYRRMFDHAVEDLDRDYKEYKRDPETHPLYDEEWRRYWLKKSKTLRNEGIDTSTYNFQPGWVRFFSRRVHQLYEDAVEDIRTKLRERLGLPRINNTLRNNRYHIGVHCVSDPVSDVEDEDVSDRNVPEREPEQELPPPKQRDTYQSNKYTPVLKNIPQDQPQSSSVRYPKDSDERLNYPKTMIERQKQQSIKENQRERPKTEIIYDLEEPQKDVVMDLGIETGPLSSVSVLRLLTALEDQLGSLGPKVIDLLSKALTLEKVKPNCADESLLTMENCVFLETVNEKLKGQIIAGVIDGSKMKAVRQAIKDLAQLLKIANEHLAKNPQPPPAPKEVMQRQPKPVVPAKRVAAPSTAAPAPKAPCLDKHDVAAKLAAALTAQGKTDFSSDQLEQLVAVYTLIEKKQRENAASNKPDGMMEGTTTEQQKKSLSETLLDFLKPNAAGQPNSSNIGNQSTNVGNQQSTNLISRGQLQQQTAVRNQSIINPNNALASTSSNRMSGSNFSNNPFSTSSQQQRSQPSSSNIATYNFNQLKNFDTSLNLPSLNRNPIISSHSAGNIKGSNQMWANTSRTSSTNMPQQNQQFSSANMNKVLSTMNTTNMSSLLNQNLSQLIQGLTNRAQNSPNMNLSMTQGSAGGAGSGSGDINNIINNLRAGQSSFGSVQPSSNQYRFNQSGNILANNPNIQQNRSSQQTNQQNQYAFNQSGNILANNSNMQQNRSTQQNNSQNQYGFNQLAAGNMGGNNNDSNTSMQQNRSGFNQNQQNIRDNRDNFNSSNTTNQRQIWSNQNSNQQQGFFRDDNDHGDDDDDDNNNNNDDDDDEFTSNNNAPAVTSTSMTRGSNMGNRNNPFSGNNANSSLISYPSNDNRKTQLGNNNSTANPFRGGNRSQPAPMGWQSNTGGRR